MIQPSEVILEFDTGVYRLAAVKKAAYKFGGRCHVQIEMPTENRAKVTLRPKRAEDDIRFIGGEFQNEVLDQDLREVVAEETLGVRNLLLAQAFSATSLLDPHGETADDRDDPLNVRRADKQRGQILPPFSTSDVQKPEK